MTWPTDSDGTTADQLPYGYSVYRSIWDDRRGYAPEVLPDGLDESGRETILIVLSPGAYISGTLAGQGKVPGQDPEGSRKLILDALAVVRRTA